ncbi:MAG: YesL family protein, partial [Parasporobacterium sp.]|nr:YesL family protein [Parasporobacterium sp.]
MRIFNPDSKFSQFIYSALDYIKLGLLFLLFSIPGITAGTAAAAVMTVGMRMERGEAPVVFKSFLKAFRDNFRQGTVLGLIFMAAFGIIAGDWYVMGYIEVTGTTRLVSAFLFLLALASASLALWA